MSTKVSNFLLQEAKAHAWLIEEIQCLEKEGWTRIGPYIWQSPDKKSVMML